VNNRIETLIKARKDLDEEDERRILGKRVRKPRHSKDKEKDDKRQRR
jgi:hypothetical protein